MKNSKENQSVLEFLKEQTDVYKVISEFDFRELCPKSYPVKNYQCKIPLHEDKILEVKKMKRIERVNATACVIGSKKYKDLFPIVAAKYTKCGYNVIYSPFLDEELNESELYNDELSEVCMTSAYDRIDQSDMVIVINDEHIGTHTMIEIAYAIYTKTPVVYAFNDYSKDDRKYRGRTLPVLMNHDEKYITHVNGKFSLEIALIIQLFIADKLNHDWDINQGIMASSSHVVLVSYDPENLSYYNDIMNDIDLSDTSRIHTFLVTPGYNVGTYTGAIPSSPELTTKIIPGVFDGKDSVYMTEHGGWVIKDDDNDMLMEYENYSFSVKHIFALESDTSAILSISMKRKLSSVIMKGYRSE